MGFTTTIKRVHWQEKMKMLSEKGLFYEYKVTSEFWNKRLEKLETPCEGVFLVGSEVHRVTVVDCWKIDTNKIYPKIDLLTTPQVWVLACKPKESPVDTSDVLEKPESGEDLKYSYTIDRVEEVVYIFIPPGSPALTDIFSSAILKGEGREQAATVAAELVDGALKGIAEKEHIKRLKRTFRVILIMGGLDGLA